MVGRVRGGKQWQSGKLRSSALPVLLLLLRRAFVFPASLSTAMIASMMGRQESDRGARSKIYGGPHVKFVRSGRFLLCVENAA